MKKLLTACLLVFFLMQSFPGLEFVLKDNLSIQNKACCMGGSVCCANGKMCQHCGMARRANRSSASRARRGLTEASISSCPSFPFSSNSSFYTDIYLSTHFKDIEISLRNAHSLMNSEFEHLYVIFREPEEPVPLV